MKIDYNKKLIILSLKITYNYKQLYETFNYE